MNWMNWTLQRLEKSELVKNKIIKILGSNEFIIIKLLFNDEHMNIYLDVDNKYYVTYMDHNKLIKTEMLSFSGMKMFIWNYNDKIKYNAVLSTFETLLEFKVQDISKEDMFYILKSFDISGMKTKYNKRRLHISVDGYVTLHLLEKDLELTLNEVLNNEYEVFNQGFKTFSCTQYSSYILKNAYEKKLKIWQTSI